MFNFRIENQIRNMPNHLIFRIVERNVQYTDFTNSTETFYQRMIMKRYVRTRNKCQNKCVCKLLFMNRIKPN